MPLKVLDNYENNCSNSSNPEMYFKSDTCDVSLVPIVKLFRYNFNMEKNGIRRNNSFCQEVTSQPVLGFDPLPPPDSITTYTRPERYAEALLV